MNELLKLKQQTKTIPINLLVQNRIPRDFFVTEGIGESDNAIHAGSYHLALKDAGIDVCNIMVYSSILPSVARRIEKNTTDLVHGSVMETIMACSNQKKGIRATVGIIFGWLYGRKTNEKYGGLVCEHSGTETEEEATDILKKSLKELYSNGYDRGFILRDVSIITKSFVPEKKFGTALVALCFKNYIYPIINVLPKSE